MALLEPQKSAIRRHLKYGNIGLQTNNAGGGSLGANAGWRYFGEWGDLEIRMDSLSPVDEATLTGVPYGVLMLQGTDPDPGDVLAVTISGGGLASPVTVSLTAPADSTRNQFVLQMAAKIAQNPLINAARIVCLAPNGPGRSETYNPLSEIQFVAQSSFNIAIQTMTGQIGANVAYNNQMTDVYQILGGVNVYGFLPICNQLYALMGSASDRMGIDKADVFVARKTEYKERRIQWKQAVDDMADFLVARVNPQPLNGGNSSIGIL